MNTNFHPPVPTQCYNLKLQLPDSPNPFNLAKAVCSHGLFMMSPNHWDPNTNTLSRPLRLSLHNDPDALLSVNVEISHPKEEPQSLNLRVFGSKELSVMHQQALRDQVKRMLRLSDVDERNVTEFRKIYGEVDHFKSFDGRVFRSPTLFEDMVKCILLCNCQWPRTLSMARALCELQLELQSHSPIVPSIQGGTVTAKGPGTEAIGFTPKTPQRKELKQKSEVSIVSPKTLNHFVETKTIPEIGACSSNDCQLTAINMRPVENVSSDDCSSCANDTQKEDVNLIFDSQFREGTEPFAVHQIGNFPSPSELAAVDEKLLAKRCNLGYRAGRILKLAQGIVNGEIRLEDFEDCREATVSGYDRLVEQLRGVEGFGPFTCANVLMCAGFYHVIPTDSETVRHLKQVHKRKSSVQTVQRDVEDIYKKYEPYQFLAYWAEVWHFYEQRFGKLSEMSSSDYKLITASNMKSQKRGVKRRKIT